MKTLIATALLTLGFTPFALAQAPPKITLPAISFQNTPTISSWSGSVYYDLRNKHAAAVIFNRIGDLTIHGRLIGIEVDGFAGVSNEKGGPATLGFAAIWHHTLVDQIQLEFGLGGSLTGGKFGGGPILGARISF